MDVREQFEALGFTLATTGGNCTAFVDGYWNKGGPYRMVTVAGDAEAPTDLDDEVVMCAYESGDDEGREEFVGLCRDLLQAEAVRGL